MEAWTELLDRLGQLCPESKSDIEGILAGYLVERADVGTMSMTDRINMFLDAKRLEGLKAKTIKEYHAILMLFALRTHKSIESVNADDIRAHINYLLMERGLKAVSAQTHSVAIRSFFSWLEAEEVIEKHPMRRIKSLKVNLQDARHPLTPEELELLRCGCKTDREKALVEFMVSSGCRVSEVAGITVDQIDWNNRAVVVHGKGDKDRIVYFSIRAKLMMQRYIASRGGGTALFVTTRKDHTPMAARSIAGLLKKIGEQAGEERNIHPHLMRHTFASNALNSGMDLAVIQKLMGHSDPRTTMIYAELRQDTIKNAYEKVIA